jgi:hypothetical protein
MTASRIGTFFPGGFQVVNHRIRGTKGSPVMTLVNRLGWPAGSPGIPLIFGIASRIQYGSQPPSKMSGMMV